MLKNILNLKGALKVSKENQKNILGGARPCPQLPLNAPPGYGACFINGCYFLYHCQDTCPNGTDPFCHAGDY